MKLIILVFLIANTLACTGGMNRANRDGYCFNDPKTGTYNPLPVQFEDENYRKASFNIQLNEKELEYNQSLLIDESEIQLFSAPHYGGGDLKDKIGKSEAERLQREKLRRQELAKIYPLNVGYYEYVSAEIFTSRFLPQKTSLNKYQRIHVAHQKNKKNGEWMFSNTCVSNLPDNASLAPVALESIHNFEIKEDGEVLNEKIVSYSIAFENWRLLHEFNEYLKEQVPLSPQDFFNKPDLSHQLYKIVNTNALDYTHELRFKGKQEDMDYYIALRFKHYTPEEWDKKKD